MPIRDAIAAGAWAAALSGAPSTVHALVRGRDPLEATKAAGSILLPRETRTPRLVAAAVPVHLALSFGWALVLERLGLRGAGRGAAAGLAIAAIDLGLVGRYVASIGALPAVPQLADHVLYGTIVGSVLARRD
ncbi:MAG TPA: hypothetical protein VFY02_06950 [Gaiellaceae bacterium]|nr:hypothetical protein [Gaiellaceae bacterium]